MDANDDGLLMFDSAPSAVAWADRILTRYHTVGTIGKLQTVSGGDTGIVKDTAHTISLCVAMTDPKLTGLMYRYIYGHTDSEAEKYLLYETIGGIGEKYGNLGANQMTRLAIATLRSVRWQRRNGRERVNIKKLCESARISRQRFYDRGYVRAFYDLKTRIDTWMEMAEKDIYLLLNERELIV